MIGRHFRRQPWWRRSGVVVAVVVVVIAALGAGGWWVARPKSPHRVQTASGSGPTSISPAPTATPGGSILPTSGTSAPMDASTTVITGDVSFSPPVSLPGSFTYTIPAGTTIRLVAAHQSWIEVKQSADGPVLHTETMEAGETLTYTSPVWIRFGDPTNVTASAGSIALELPTDSGDLIINSS